MTFLEFKKGLWTHSLFSIRDVTKVFPDFDSRRLVEWQQKKYIRKIINRWYLFNDTVVDEMMLIRISNCIYKPSYLSLESALSYYHFIPEGVYSQQAITTRKTMSYQTQLGTFNYRTLKPHLYFGYKILHQKNFPVIIAEAEKTILDYLFLNSSLRTLKDIASLRLNYSEIETVVNWEKFDMYALMFKSKTLDKRIKYLKKLLHNANIN